MATTLHAVALLLYVALGLQAVRRWGLARDEAPAPKPRAWALAAVVHAAALGVRALQPEAPGLAESLSGVGLGVAVAIVGFAQGERGRLVPFLAPVAALFAGAGLVAPGAHPEASGNGLWVAVHVALVLAGMSAMLVEAAVAVAAALLRRQLKRKELAALDRYPSLASLEVVQQRALALGLVLLGLGVVLGAWTAAQLLPHAVWVANPKVLFTAAVWGWYAAAALLRAQAGWQSRGAFAMSLVGAAAILFSLFGLDYVVRGFHGYLG